MTIITEGTLQFDFAPDWDVIKFDDNLFYSKIRGTGVQAMDVLGKNNDIFWWIEIKDCQGHESACAFRFDENTESPELAKAKNFLKKEKLDSITVAIKKPFIIHEIMKKFRDTLVTLHAAKYTNESSLSNFSLLDNEAIKIKIILLLTLNDIEFKRLAKGLQQKLNTALLPYGLQGFVVNEETFSKIIPSCTISRINPPTK